MRNVFLIDIAAYLHRAMHVVYGDSVASVPETDARFVDHACGMLAHTPVFAAQAPRFFEALCDLSVTVFQQPRYEADDLIASIVQNTDESYTIVTHDKDLLALVNDKRKVCAHNPMSGAVSRETDVR